MTQKEIPAFSVGICAAENSHGVHELVGTVMRDAANSGMRLHSLVIVASGCSPDAVRDLRQMAASNRAIDLIVEESRRGKAEAVNRIMRRTKGDYLVLVNSDAHPEPGAIVELLETISAEDDAGVVSAQPVPRHGRGMSSLVTEFMWEAHNECSLALNHMNVSNHSSDELMAVRRDAVRPLPIGLVNDGAFLAGTTRRLGYTVRFSPKARVGIETPSRVADVIRQRRRILFGHAEIWRKTGSAPKTVESLMLLDTVSALRIFVRTVAKRPKFILALPFATVSEVSSAFLSIWDSLRGSDRHTVWRRYR